MAARRIAPKFAQWLSARTLLGGYMRVHLAFMFSLMCGAALFGVAKAETPSPTVATPPDQTIQVSLPSSIGSLHTCPPDRWYPQSSLHAGQSGTTMLVFRIDKEGKTTNVIVKASSGFPAIDAASIACVSEWTYVPAQLNGSSIEALWATNVYFLVSNSRPIRSASSYLSPSLQLCPGYPGSNLLSPVPTAVLIATGDDGLIASSSIAQSSGDPSLDAFALACVSGPAFKQDIASGEKAARELLFPIYWPKQSK